MSRTTSDSIRPSIHQSMEFNDEEKTVWKKKEKKRQADVVFFGGRSCGFQVSMRWIAFFLLLVKLCFFVDKVWRVIRSNE